jgi:hypothetical protein
MKTGHFESGIAQQAAIAVLMRDVSLQHSIVTLAAKGWSARKPARELGLHRGMVGSYLRAANPIPRHALTHSGQSSLLTLWPKGVALVSCRTN